MSSNSAKIWICAIALILQTGLTAQAQSNVRSQDYLRDVISLSEVLGKAHAVRTICNGRNDQYWRDYMQRLMDIEAPYRGGLRDSMVNGFNAGFSVGTARHRICNTDTVAAEKTYASEGRTLTSRLATENMPSTARR